jgi:hypothetical protein
MNICFIDDCFSANGNKARVDQIDLLGSQENLTVHKVLPSQLREWKDMNSIEMDLIFIDYKLHEDRDANGIFNVGNEIVSLVRTLFPDTPLYLLSVDIVRSKEYERAEGFERKVGENYLSQTAAVYHDINDHAALKSVIAERNMEKLLTDILKTPLDVKDDLKNSIHGSIRKYFSTPRRNVENHEKVNIGTRVEFYRWFIDLFYKYPGFLLNEDACALYLGLSVDHFKSISTRFDDALYEGIFFKTFEPRWWKSKIEDLIISLDEHDVLNTCSFSEASAKVLNAPPTGIAMCAYCNTASPEELAVTEDTTDSDLVMVHVKCSSLDEDFNVGPYFHKPRIVKTQ